MIYKIVIDARKALNALNKLGIKAAKKEYFFWQDADNPDEACHAAVEQLKDLIIRVNLTEEVVDYLEEELIHEIKIVKLVKIRPYA
tara:strand:+ start:6794 stop:7051 length:258 start_codon:yes stop_codon:yes gene_type:complete